MQFRFAHLSHWGLLMVVVWQLPAQQPPVNPMGGRGGLPSAAGFGGDGGVYPTHPKPEPDVLARGKALWESNCVSCHAVDLRGSSRGINLVRSRLVLDDQHGEQLGPFLKAPHAAGGAPAVSWTAGQLEDVAAYMHTFENYRNVMVPVPPSAVLVGDPAAGETYYKSKCASCHSVDGTPSQAASLQGIGSRVGSPKAMQNAIVSGNAGGGRGGRGAPLAPADHGDRPAPPNPRAVTARLTWPSGAAAEGTVVSRDEFLIVLRDKEGLEKSYRRDGDVPKVEIHDPLKPHRDLLTVYTDKDIHDLTAYLVTLK